MRASVGDQIVIRGHRIGEPSRTGEIIEVRGADGGPPYGVRWDDSGHETIFYPGPDAHVRPLDHTRQIETISEAVGAATATAAEAIRRSGVAVECNRTIKEAAETMERTGVGALAILDAGTLVGIVTDRDLVRRALATGMAPDARVDAAMSTPVFTIDADSDLHHAFSLFREHGVRRLAVVRGEAFVGMITVDDLLIDLAADLSDLARPVAAEARSPHRDSSVPAKT